MLPSVLLGCFIRDGKAIYMSLLFPPGGGSEKNRGERPKELCGQKAESRMIPQGPLVASGSPLCPGSSSSVVSRDGLVGLLSA